MVIASSFLVLLLCCFVFVKDYFGYEGFFLVVPYEFQFLWGNEMGIFMQMAMDL